MLDVPGFRSAVHICTEPSWDTAPLTWPFCKDEFNQGSIACQYTVPLTSNLNARASHARHTRALKHAYVSKQMHTREYLNMYMRSIHTINTHMQCVNTPIWAHTCEWLKCYTRMHVSPTHIMNLSLTSKLCVTHTCTRCTDKLLDRCWCLFWDGTRSAASLHVITTDQWNASVKT